MNLEFNRTLYAKWIDWDMAMYDTETKTFAHARHTPTAHRSPLTAHLSPFTLTLTLALTLTLTRCSTLAEDLGQIEYVLTDKTGTLTENQMVRKQSNPYP